MSSFGNVHRMDRKQREKKKKTKIQNEMKITQHTKKIKCCRARNIQRNDSQKTAQ